MVVSWTMQAADALALPSPACAGNPYFITNAEPRPFWGFLGDFLEPLGYQRPTKKLPWRLIFFIAILVELIIWLLKPFKVSRPCRHCCIPALLCVTSVLVWVFWPCMCLAAERLHFCACNCWILAG